MSASRLRRLRAMRREEIAFRLKTIVRTHLQRVATAAVTPRWHRTDLPSVLAPGVADRAVQEAIDGGDWMTVHRRLADVLRARPGRFALDIAQAPALRQGILRRWPDAAAHAAQRADRIIAGEHDLLGYRGLQFARNGTIDWHLDPVSRRSSPHRFFADVAYLDPQYGDHKVIWEINRHQHWLALGRALLLTGDRRYRAAILAQLDGWLAANPPLVGINWASMLELGFRSLSWVATLHLLLGDRHDDAGASEGPWLVDLLVALDRQLTHVEGNLSHYFSPNTHLLGEALALYVAGHALPELRRSGRFVATGRRILLEQIDRQIEPDGGHAERSLHYHRYTLDFYLLALLTAERTGDAAAPAFRAAARRLACFLRELADDDGRMPQIGDDDGGALWSITGGDPDDARDSLALAAAVLGAPELAPWGVTEGALWLAWNRGSEPAGGDASTSAAVLPAARTTAYADTGYVVIRDGRGGHLIFDAGPLGFLNGGHAHADALAVTLAVDGRRLLVDPGTSTYTGNPVIRDRLRRTMNHNTLTLDGASPSEPAGPFHWRSRADARLAGAGGTGSFGWADGFHDGYPGLRHRRLVVTGPHAGWLVIDHVSGAAPALAERYWHLDPAWTVAARGDRAVRASHPDGAAAWLVHDDGRVSLWRGDEATGLGWCAPSYGTLLPTWSVRVASSLAPPPFARLAWIGDAADDPEPPVLQPLPAAADPAAAVVAAHLVRRRSSSVTIVRTGEAADPSRPHVAGAYRTDARILQYTTAGDRLLAFAAAGVREAAADAALLSLSADEPVPDIQVRLADGWLDIAASTPPARLRMAGGALEGMRAVRLNGRPADAARIERHTLTLTAADWPVSLNEAREDTCVA